MLTVTNATSTQPQVVVQQATPGIQCLEGLQERDQVVCDQFESSGTQSSQEYYELGRIVWDE